MSLLLRFFDSGPSFLDPQTCKDGSPYGPKRFKELVQECYFISDTLHTSYADVLDISVMERLYLIDFINQKNENTKKAIDASIAEARAKNNR